MNKINDIIENIHYKFQTMCYCENIEILEEFLERFSSIININYEDGLLLIIIVKRNDIKLIDLFIKYGADVNELLWYAKCTRPYCEVKKYLESLIISE